MHDIVSSNKKSKKHPNRISKLQIPNIETESFSEPPQQQAVSKAILKQATLESRLLTPNDVLSLQRSIGNQASVRLLHQKLKNQSLNDNSTTPPVIQRMEDPTPKKVTLHVDDSGNVLKVDSDKGSLEFSVNGEVKVGGVSIIVRKGKGSKGDSYTVMYLLDKGDYRKVKRVDVVVSTSKEVAPSEEPGLTEFLLKITDELEEKSLFQKNIPIQGFESKESAERHVAKHGKEFGVEDLKKYLKAARDFGNEVSVDFCEAIIDNTIIRVDAPGKAVRRVLILNGRKLRTFYVWDEVFSDPFAYAIYYTITHNKKIPLRNIPAAILDQLEEYGVMLFEIEKEVIDKMLDEGKNINEIEAATLAPRTLIAQRRTYRPMEKALSEAARF